MNIYTSKGIDITSLQPINLSFEFSGNCSTVKEVVISNCYCKVICSLVNVDNQLSRPFKFSSSEMKEYNIKLNLL